MALDIILTTKLKQQIYLAMSETLHSTIFSLDTNWQCSKSLRKISDYYKVNIIFTDNEINLFIEELSEFLSKENQSQEEITNILELLKKNDFISIKITGD